MKNTFNISMISIIVLILSLFLVSPIISKTFAATETHEIRTFEDLLAYANLSRTEGHNDDEYVLLNDITITNENQTTLQNGNVKYISFGSENLPFTGVFNGNGYKISNLKYDSTLDVKSDTGLFSYTGEGAVIKNLIIDNANLQADYRGGIVAGYSKGTLFEDIVVQNSHLFVSAANNVLTLVTDGGIRGGAIVGDANGSVLYNCESTNNIINTNNTSGVAALAGKGLTLGALVGIADNTTIEYSRVYGGSVKNHYDVAVGALGGNTLYVGGIAGKLTNSAKVIDCFSTAELYFYCATYVSVGAGNSGHIGGIAGIMEGATSEILRSHYAGVATSKQYNAILVIPIIETNVNISGIVDIHNAGSVSNAYFKPSVNPDVKMMVLGNKDETTSYRPVSDENYVDISFWQSQSFDMAGGIKRSTAYNGEHYNKWVIDNTLGIPIHGKSVSATLDFKNAGTVTISETELVKGPVSTGNPYSFAVQGLFSGELTVNLTATENTGYRFESWYNIPNVTAWSLEEKYEYFKEVFNYLSPVSQEKSYLNAPADNNNLFIARYKTNVVFHDIYGNILNKHDGTVTGSSSNTDDWYYYNETLPNVKPVNEPDSETAKLIGWTTTKSSEAGGGYTAITAAELSSLKANNTFYETGDYITQTLDLYPVYVNLISNIITEFEGHEQDNSSNTSLRENVGSTSVTTDSEDHVVITVTGALTDGAFPEGYRFLGWYNEDGVRISKSTSYTITDIDLSTTHTFTARFEYLVQYFVRAFAQDNGNLFTDSELYAERWHIYNSQFNNIKSPGYLKEYITHWGTAHVNHGSSNNESDAYSGNIIAPLKVYSHNYETATGDGTGYELFATMDFPGAGQIHDNEATLGAKLLFTPIDSNRYHLNFWTLERKREGWTYISNLMNTGTLDPSVTYKAMAMVTTDVVFHKKTDETITVTRRYQNNVILDTDVTHTYKYPFMHTEEIVSTTPQDGSSGDVKATITLEASPTDSSMEIDGYEFLGWISSDEVQKDSDEWNAIYDVEGDLYTSSNLYTAQPYLIDNGKLVYETLDIYPVYVKYNVETKTNVDMDGISSEINKPNAPTYTLDYSETEKGKATVNLNIDLDTYVTGSSGEKFDLISVVRVHEDGTKEIINPDANNMYKYEIEAGPTYTFMAIYEPYMLLYHLNNNNIETIVKGKGQEVGDMPEPTYSMSNFDAMTVFAGWTTVAPENNYHLFNGYDEYINSDIEVITSLMLVNESMELYPVYVTSSIVINSNIDNYLTENSINLSSIRTGNRESVDNIRLLVKDTEIDDYKFVGWYKNFESISKPGEKISENVGYTLDPNDSLGNYVYTAVYKKVYQVKYYNTDREVLYTVDVLEDENRTFYKNAVDENGEIVNVIIDSEAFIEIRNSLSENEMLLNWQVVKDDNSVVQWEAFSNEVITSNMNLYPIITRTTVTDHNGEELDVSGTEEQEPEVIIGFNKENVIVALNMLYENPELTVHVEEIAYNKDDEDVTVTTDRTVKVYPNDTLEDELLQEIKTNGEGDAEFYFEKVIKISKELLESRQNDIILFKIAKQSAPENIILTVSVSKENDGVIRLPYGRYIVTEDEEWAWRYSTASAINININNCEEKNAEFDNGIENTKWFDYMDISKNKFD